jgi:hypothetical protein
MRRAQESSARRARGRSGATTSSFPDAGHHRFVLSGEPFIDSSHPQLLLPPLYPFDPSPGPWPRRAELPALKLRPSPPSSVGPPPRRRYPSCARPGRLATPPHGPCTRHPCPRSRLVSLAASPLVDGRSRCHGHRAQQLTAMALRIAGRRRRSARRHGRARGRQKRGRKLRAVPPELWEPLGSAPSRALPTPGLELAHGPDDAGGAGPRCARRREQGMAARPRGARGRRRAHQRREEDEGRCRSPSPPRSLRGTEPRRARPRPLLLRYAAVGEGEGVGREGPAPSGVEPCSSASAGPALGAPAPPRPPVLSRCRLGRAQPWRRPPEARALAGALRRGSG